jgi:hypothetical protein
MWVYVMTTQNTQNVWDVPVCTGVVVAQVPHQKRNIKVVVEQASQHRVLFGARDDSLGSPVRVILLEEAEVVPL